MKPWVYSIYEEGPACIVWADTEREAVAMGNRQTCCPGTASPAESRDVAYFAIGGELEPALVDVLAEREKQRAKWSDAHDDGHLWGALSVVAASLAVADTDAKIWDPLDRLDEFGRDTWGLSVKHPDRRDRLVIAAALLLAEVERIDRAIDRAAPTEEP